MYRLYRYKNLKNNWKNLIIYLNIINNNSLMFEIKQICLAKNIKF